VTRAPFSMRRRSLLALGAAAPLAARAAGSAAPTGRSTDKTLRVAFPVAETGFDPAQVHDLYSRTVLSHILDAPLDYDYQARPARLRPNTTIDLPEISRDFRTFTLHIRRGIYFQDDPAFKGVRRELTAADYAFSFKRFYDPRWKSPMLFVLENSRIADLTELRAHALQSSRPFEYDRAVEGIRALAVDKDQSPRWNPGRIEDVTRADVEAFFVSPWPAHAHPLRMLG